MYLNWNALTIDVFSDNKINSLYNEGYLFTRTGKGDMYQTRSIRIDLSKFELSSENKRVLKKTEDIGFKVYDIPYEKYDWSIGKMAKDFYETRFGRGTPALNRAKGSGLVFSANKIKELLTTKHNFNKLFVYSLSLREAPEGDEAIPSKNGIATPSTSLRARNDSVGYVICHETNELLHYSYPFYNLDLKSYVLSPNTGMGMMLQAIIYAQKQGKKYVYLGSAKDAKAKYKLQFAGLEWFDGKTWQTDLEELKQQIMQNKQQAD
ncbi:MAG: hypothetical protein US42_C0001G0059 [Candidatus Magasanikbacteria bacterium GW2011_GWC2_37_14]|uniref:Uncharacterized protein n=1 Tax=Candidatus Magasanikbacteria bacterium GW2011_GWC2_37_14 TaxID=1619046 RepID=A0A0G0GAT0_9BACT|nr:MAG: hypothetical protein US42_C0001G0059 [Candidatus Magasanikbacteria bacterium GW2011_GWC2_37_14]